MTKRRRFEAVLCQAWCEDRDLGAVELGVLAYIRLADQMQREVSLKELQARFGSSGEIRNAVERLIVSDCLEADEILGL